MLPRRTERTCRPAGLGNSARAHPRLGGVLRRAHPCGCRSLRAAPAHLPGPEGRGVGRTGFHGSRPLLRSRRYRCSDRCPAAGYRPVCRRYRPGSGGECPPQHPPGSCLRGRPVRSADGIAEGSRRHPGGQHPLCADGCPGPQAPGGATPRDTRRPQRRGGWTGCAEAPRGGAPRWLASGGYLFVESSEEQAGPTAGVFKANGLVASIAHSEQLCSTVVTGALP